MRAYRSAPPTTRENLHAGIVPAQCGWKFRRKPNPGAGTLMSTCPKIYARLFAAALPTRLTAPVTLIRNFIMLCVTP